MLRPRPSVYFLVCCGYVIGKGVEVFDFIAFDGLFAPSFGCDVAVIALLLVVTSTTAKKESR